MTYPRDKEFPKLTVKQDDFLRTIKGPCFDECADSTQPDGRQCRCEYFALTEPHEKINPEQGCADCNGSYCGDKYEPCGCDCHDEL